ncbi:MAG: insulinase family protein [bacterium]
MKCFLQRLLLLLTLCAAAGLLTGSVAQEKVWNVNETLVPDPATIIGKLDNGMVYYIRENKKPEKRCEVRLAVKVGSVVEDDDQQGLAHFVEHMAFNGTKNFPKQDIINLLEKAGMKFGPEVNAGTSFDETTYMLQLPTDSIHIMKKGFQILQEWAGGVAFDDKEIDKERGVIIEEWRLGRGAQMRMLLQHLPYLLYNSQYANRFVIGKKEILESFTYETIKRYYRDWYRPDLMAIVAVGDFDKKQIEALIKENFSGLKNPASERPRQEFPVPDHKETFVSIATDAEWPMTMAQIFIKREARDTYKAGDYRDEIIGQIYDGMLSARYMERTQKPNPPFLGAQSIDQRVIGKKQYYILAARFKETSILEGLDALVSEAYRVKQHGFTETELERQRKQMLSSFENSFKERDKRQSRALADEYVRNFLTNETIPGIEVEYELVKQFLPGIALAEVNKLASVRLRDESRVITLWLPKKATVKVPTEEEVKKVFLEASTKQLDAYVDKVSTKPLIAKMPQPGKVVGEKKLESLGVTEWTLSNGSRVVLKPTDFKNDEILFSAYSNGGNSLVADKDFLTATNATSIVSQSGVGEFDAIVLQKMLTGKRAGVYPMISSLSEGFSGSASPQDLETMFQLTYLYGTAPRKDTSAISSLMTRMKESLKNRGANPEAVFSDTVQVTLTNYHFRGRPMTIDRMNEINPDKALQIYKDRFADFSDFTFFLVGNFQLEKIKPLVEQYLASLPTTGRKESWKDVGVKLPVGKIDKKVFRGMEPKSTVQLMLSGPFEWTAQNRYDFTALIDVMNIKLREIVREEKGGTYGISIGGSPSLYPRKEYSIMIQWGCDPGRVDELVKAVLQQIDSLKMKAPDQIYIDKVKEQHRRTREVQMKENGFWLSAFRTYYANNENPEEILNYSKRVEKLDGKSVLNAAKKYLSTKNFVKCVLYPEKKK